MQSISLSTIIRNSSLTATEIHRFILNSIDGDASEWKLAEFPHVNQDLLLAIGSLPKQIRNGLAETLKFKPYLIVDLEHAADLIVPQVKLALKLKFSYEEVQIPTPNQILDEFSRSDEERLFLCRKHRMIDLIIHLLDVGEAKQKDVFECLIQFGLNYYSHYSSFNRFINEYRDRGIKSLLHNARNSKKSRKQKWTQEHLATIGHLYGKGFDRNEIQKKLKGYCEESNLAVLSRPTVSRLIKEHFINVIYAEKRHGSGFVKNNICSHLEKTKPRFKLQVIEADGSRLQLPYRVDDNSKWKIRFLTIYVIVDVASRKVIGYSIDDYENKEMALLAFYMMLRLYSRLPAFIRLDRSSAHKSNRFKRFLRKSEALGMDFRFCREPSEKGTVESFYRWFPDKICKQFDCYTGMSILTTSWDIKPNPERVQKIFDSKSKVPSRVQLIRSIPKLINEWNSNYNSGSKSTANTLFDQLNYGNAIFINKPNWEYLTWRIKNKERFSRNTVVLYRKNERYSYRLQDAESIIELHGKPYVVAWIESAPSYVIIYSTNGEFIGVADRKHKYLDDPINIAPSDHKAMIKEKNQNYEVLKTMKTRVSKMNKLIKHNSKSLVEFNITSPLNSDKWSASEVETAFVNTYMINRPSIPDSSEEYKEEEIKNKELDKNFISFKPKSHGKI